jgi:protein transport protein SEC24
VVNDRPSTGKGPQKSDDIPRCDQCRGFINPFFEFLDNRRNFKCNLCNKIQATPAQYIDSYGDYSNTEIGLGSYEFIASQDYTARMPKEPSYFFLIDISPSSWRSNIPFYAVTALKETIKSARFNGENAASFGVAFFDSQIHFLKLKGKRPSLVTMNPSIDANYRIPSVG